MNLTGNKTGTGSVLKFLPFSSEQLVGDIVIICNSFALISWDMGSRARNRKINKKNKAIVK